MAGSARYYGSEVASVTGPLSEPPVSVTIPEARSGAMHFSLFKSGSANCGYFVAAETPYQPLTRGKWTTPNCIDLWDVTGKYFTSPPSHPSVVRSVA